METQTATTKVATHKDVQTLLNERIIEQLEKGIIPWCKPWSAGIPKNLVTGNPYRNINLVLLSCLGYERNLFIREKQMKEVGASILPGERPHMVAYWNYKDDTGKEQAPQLRYYLVYNVAQCSGISANLLAEHRNQRFDVESCQRIVTDMQHRPAIKSKQQLAFYDVMEDYINMPKLSAFPSEAEHYSKLYHELMHSTGHHTRLDRMGLVQMTEFGYVGCSQEEIVAEIGTRYLEALTGITGNVPWSDAYLQTCIAKMKADKTFIFTAASLAQKAIDFILDVVAETVEAAEETVVA